MTEARTKTATTSHTTTVIAAIYARKSTEQAVADEAKSVRRQIEHARQYATRKCWTVPSEAYVYVDDGISGAEFERRPGLQRLLSDAQRGAFQVVIVADQSRLGREAWGTQAVIKQLAQAGVEVWAYLGAVLLTPRNAIDKAMSSLRAFGDEAHREASSVKGHESHATKHRLGHVVGGRTFGYRNVDVISGHDAHGRPLRSHVERVIEPAEAEIIRQIFALSIEGHGVKAIAKALNAAGALSPRAQQGRPQCWAPSSVRAVLHRELYSGISTWNKSRKRDAWGSRSGGQAPRPETDWIRVENPALRIIDVETWRRAHDRLATVRRVYLSTNRGSTFGRPALGSTLSKYLLTGLSACGVCGGTLHVRSWSHGKGRRHFYACSNYHERGRTICTNKSAVPMADTNAIVIEALLDDVLDQDILQAAIDRALELIVGDQSNRLLSIEAEIEQVTRERDRLIAGIASGVALDAILEALRARENRLKVLESERAAELAQRPTVAFDGPTVRRELMTRARDWRRVLTKDPGHARPIITSLLDGRVTVTPSGERGRWELTGTSTIAGLFSGEIFQEGWRPHRDSNPGFSLERAAS